MGQQPNLVDHFDSLYRYALVLTRNRTEAEDLVQETYARAFEKLDSVRDPGSIKNWLFTVLRNAWNSQLRRRQTARIDVGIDLGANPDIAVDPSDDALTRYINKFECDLVRQALMQLPLEAREILILREFDDLSYQEIANLLGCPIGTVMSRLGRARAKLRELLSASLAPSAQMYSNTIATNEVG